MAATRESSTELRTLRALTTGAVVAPADPGYDEARMAWNLAVDQRPEAVVFPENETDVAFAVAYAREAGLRVSVQGTGHNPLPLGDIVAGGSPRGHTGVASPGHDRTWIGPLLRTPHAGRRRVARGMCQLLRRPFRNLPLRTEDRTIR